MSPEVVVAGPGRPAATGTAGSRHTQSVNTNDGRGADIWALGILLVELTIGSLPVPLCGSGSTAETLQGVLDIARARAQNRARVPGRMGSRITAESDSTPGPAKIWPDDVSAQYRTAEAPLRQLVDQCLEPHCAHRLDARSLLRAHEQFARHLSTSNAHKGEMDRGHLGMLSIPTVVPPPAVPLQSAAVVQTANKVMPASESAAVTRIAVRRLCERFIEWVAQHAGDTDALDVLIDHAIDVKHMRASGARSAIRKTRRPVSTIGLPTSLGSFPMITLRDRSYSVAVPVDVSDTAEDFGQPNHERSEDLDRNDPAVLLLPFSDEERQDDEENLTSGNIDHMPSTGTETGDRPNLLAGSALELCTSASTEPQKLSVIPSSHPLWDGCSPQERQQLRVAVIADADLPVPLRERHRAYQEARVATFRALLEKLPGARNEIVQESKVDIPPVRSYAWQGL
jgi:serine/threonine protein kinase